ncbi:MAG TPA: DUF2157 domain-containing protein [Candidatus Angelobacter sp.]
MDALERNLRRWQDAQLIDSATVERILQFEQETGKRRRWPAILAIGFGTLMLCAGVLLFVAAHWDNLAPASRFTLVLLLVAVFHLAASLLGSKVESVGVALHFAGTAALGAGIFLAGQVFNLEEHWPSGLLLWAIGAVLAWVVLRQWPQALLAALLIPAWLGGEWEVASERYFGAWNIAAQGFLLLAIFYMSVPLKDRNRHLRLALIWVGAVSLLPFLGDVIETARTYSYYSNWDHRTAVPLSGAVFGYSVAYLPILIFAVIVRKRDSVWMFGAAIWVYLLTVISRHDYVEKNVWLFVWLAVGACGLCLRGVLDNRKLFINYGIAIFSLTVIGFYFSEVLDKLGRSMGLILFGVIFLAGGWVLLRLRTSLIARATAGGTQ